MRAVCRARADAVQPHGAHAGPEGPSRGRPQGWGRLWQRDGSRLNTTCAGLAPALRLAEQAAWAVTMEYTGSECIPTSVSLVETYLAGNMKRLGRLQNRDGYEGTLEVCDLAEREERLPVESITSAIERVGIFEVLTTDEVAALASSARPIVLGPHQGNKGSSLFLLQEGGLEVIAKQDGKERVLAELSPGAVVGEIAFLTGEPRTATVRATDSATVIELSAAHLKPLVEARPAILEQPGLGVSGSGEDPGLRGFSCIISPLAGSSP